MIYAKSLTDNHEDVSFLVELDNYSLNYLVDCGPSQITFKDCLHNDGIFVTHTHMDHFCYFDSIMRMQLDVGRPVPIYGPEGIARNILGKLHGYTWNLIEPGKLEYRVHEIVEDRIEIYTVGPPDCRLVLTETRTPGPLLSNDRLTIDYTILDHKIPSIAYRFCESDTVHLGEVPYPKGAWIKELKAAYLEQDTSRLIKIEDKAFDAKDLFQYLHVKKGYCVGFAMDHLPSEENQQKLIELFHNTDELFIESFYREKDKMLSREHYHSTAKESGKLARLAGVKQVHLVHHSRRYEHEIDELIREGMEEFYK